MGRVTGYVYKCSASPPAHADDQATLSYPGNPPGWTVITRRRSQTVLRFHSPTEVGNPPTGTVHEVTQATVWRCDYTAGHAGQPPQEISDELPENWVMATAADGTLRVYDSEEHAQLGLNS